ncbi:NAD(P)/FAD-dependent oxidoreductase [Anaerosalibacter bizertensis]|uniref:NAD(P)/FAD-dependent oxidoreductase n=1 Tax=Anaerosalibacter bizertensis TaxID=932217 RepID=A0A9Q4AA58_9FIRM|nr:NAD(P)/FAD-dependent oxidoreductase [Anaerosalibacter bizertensis]MBV1816507.1 NAD(P)/FAD-dependent oxidoreductase [Bacteroidales bacterium MSK.15.36]MCG4563896.1 NAD(P)/FAD-dependent oxidoreductase [Anaerosalibacter bizertensis]MCG4581566.1 NAD(P)/FAD-dependent oxidoreductase [Anaerosalibacter bizertensis]
MYDVIIIGAGIIGTNIARELSRYNTKVLIIEKDIDVSMGATKANSAIVHGGYAESHSTLRGRLCYKGRKQFKRLNEELNFGFEETGSLVVSTEDDKEPLEKLMENGIKNGLDDLSIIGSEEIREIEPELTHDAKWALYCKGAGVCSPYEMAIAMAENAIKNGVKLELENEVIDIEKIEDRFKVTTDKGEYYGKYVVNAAGLYSDKISKMVGVDNFEILPRSGEYILFTRGTGDPINTVIFQLPTKLGKGVLVTSTYYGNLLIGPDANDESDREDTSTHVERIAKIYQQAESLYDKINPKQFIRSFTGIRARSSTNDFIIEETKVKGFINVAGIQSPGLTSSPAIAEMVIGILQDAGLKLEENPNFDPYRKPIITRKPLKPFNEIKDKIELPLGSEGRIVCRCEQVLEEEIVDALHRGIKVKTIDGVKRRTRATMGWCQGDFCKPRVIEVMEREYGEKIDPSYDIEHSGVNRVQKSELLDYLNSLEEE